MGSLKLANPSQLAKAGSLAPGSPPGVQRSGWLLTSLLGGMVLGNIDIAVVNVAIPSIRVSLQATAGELELIVSGYTLAYALLLITGARLGEIHGRRWMYLLGLTVFTASSLACGLAPNGAVLVGARSIQGIGAALMVSQVLTEIQVHFEGAARRRALRAYTAVLGISSVIGRALGGVLVSADILGTGWRPIFLINIPIGVGLIIISFVFLPTSEPSHRQKLDLAGVGLLSVGLLMLVTPLVFGQDQGWPLWAWLCLFGSVPVFALFVRVERRVADGDGYPLINVHVLTRKRISLALFSQASTRACYFALLFVLALYLQQGLGKSATYSGLVPVSFAATFALAGPVLGRVGPRVRRLAAPVGGLLMAVAFVGMAVGVSADMRGTAWLVLLLGIGGLGYGAAFSGTLTHLTKSVEPRYAPDVSGLFNTTLQIGGTLGVAVFGTVYLDLARRDELPQTAFAVTAWALAVLSVAAAVLFQLANRAESGVARTIPADAVHR
jgi:MFS family permease